ncbi:hypothetical protein PoB_005022200 [Plakobranchus ocellatus]|uniref:Uncharacterized protein n=1 Tax=Plakobranchus ocellatus TaxID=259542 RepID=A0AAV4BXA5_9GAST|nr:hypothetical protein PoB_005022200 [Plakobranchus ocellatus]
MQFHAPILLRRDTVSCTNPSQTGHSFMDQSLNSRHSPLCLLSHLTLTELQRHKKKKTKKKKKKKKKKDDDDDNDDDDDGDDDDDDDDDDVDDDIDD